MNESDSRTSDQRTAKISHPMKRHGEMLLLLSLPVAALLLLSLIAERELRSILFESSCLVEVNILGWVCLVAGLSEAQRAGSQQAGSADRSHPRAAAVEASIGIVLKLIAAGWIVWRTMELGLTYLLPFLAVVVGYLFLVSLLIAAIGFRAIFPSQKAAPPASPNLHARAE